MGGKNQWQHLNRKWNARLAEDVLTFFKSSSCRVLGKNFLHIRDMPDGRPRADKLQVDLDQITHDSPVMTLGVVLRSRFTRKWSPIQTSSGD